MLRIYQAKQGYCYNSDTLFLASFISNLIKKDSTLLDIGSGAGTLGLLVHRLLEAKKIRLLLSQVEVNKIYARINNINAAANKIDSKIYNCNFLDFKSMDKFDFIVSNPPFYNENILPSKNALKAIATISSNLDFKALALNVKRLLKPRGSFVFCYSALESFKILGILKEAGFNCEAIRFIHPNKDKNASIFLALARINTRSQTKILPPLFTHIGALQLDNSKEVEQIYKACNTYSIKFDLDSSF